MYHLQLCRSCINCMAITYLHSFPVHNKKDIGISPFLLADDVWFSLSGTTYQNHSLVTLEDIGENNTSLFCMTNLSTCCRKHDSGENSSVSGNWFFPNKTRVPSKSRNWDFHRARGQMVVRMNRREGGVEGIYWCEIPDSVNVNQTMYIGVYNASTGKV